MQIRSRIGIVILMTLLVAATVLAADKGSVINTPSEKGIMDAITSAEIALKKARSVEGEWRDTGKLITEAKAAFNAGDYAEAKDLAKEAQYQGELGYSQAMSQQELQMPSYFTKVK